MRKNLTTRFFEKIQKTPTCWLWIAGKFSNGYGKFATRLGNRKSHRISWEIHNGPIPINKLVLHRCDVKSCVNPDHLWLGTQLENVRDCITKRRKAIGEKQPNSKLTDDMVKEIKATYIFKKTSMDKMAEKYQVSDTAIWNVLHKVTWVHIQ